MREILLRGKRTDNGKWVEGCLEYNPVKKLAFIKTPRHIHWDVNMVVPATVGQYTGLKDAKGNRIFEGDIVKYNGTIHQVVFESRNGCAYFGIVFDENETWEFCNSVPAWQTEVVGNVHDSLEEWPT